MGTRREGGRETWNRLREWDKGQPDSERLAARLLSGEGYQDIDPSHPLGGRDSGKDIKCTKDGRSVVVAIYFPRGQQLFSAIKKKFSDDLVGAKKQKASEFVFVTNQELTLAERAELEDIAKPILATIYHLERGACLDSPKGYGLRLEFLSIEMTKEEQISFFNERDHMLTEIREGIKQLSRRRSAAEGIRTVNIESEDDLFGMYGITSQALAVGAMPYSKLMECKNCEEIFRAQDPATFIPGMASTYPSRPDSLRTVTCPSCGKVQKYS
ncbi:MAG: hypothetical protein IPM25_07870 [Chloracidobacterium sp.]|nr:hypothetical protein [Chloracidobacterium sp.]